jgi:hypothetical protein
LFPQSGCSGPILIGLLSMAALSCGAPAPEPPTATSMLPKGAPSTFLSAAPIGTPLAAKERPLIAHVSIADLDQDTVPDVIACVAHDNRVAWLRQSPRGTFTESTIGAEVRAPAHAQVIDFDRDGDLDVVVASLGVLFPSNARIGSVIVLENQGQQRFTNRVIAEGIARVADARAGDLDGDGDLDVAIAGFGYDNGETLWLRNMGGWRFEPMVLQNLSGPINVEIVDADGDGDNDVVALVSQEWEEIYAHVNDGGGRFQSRLVWGSTNDDFGSSWLTAADMDKDGDVDFLYSNGDAFDYAPAGSRPWHGVQWVENRGSLTFVVHRIGDLSGASSPQPADLDGDGDLDVAVVSAYNDWDDPSAPSLVWLENDGKMRFAMHDVANAPTHLVTLAVADVTGDGLIDLVTGGLHASRPYDRMSRVTLWTNAWPR